MKIWIAGVCLLLAVVVMAQVKTFPPSRIGSDSAGVTPIPPPPVPIHVWDFEDDLTDSVSDLNLTFQYGSPTYAAGLDGQAVKAYNDNSTPWSSSVPTTTLDGGGSFTVTTWVKQEGIISTSFSIIQPTGATQGPWKIYNHQSLNYLAAEVWNQAQTGRYRATIAPAFDDTNVWIFVAMTWDNAGLALKLYKGTNGAALVTADGVATNWLSGPRWAGSTQFRALWYPSSWAWMDNTRIYNTALSESQIGAIYDALKP